MIITADNNGVAQRSGNMRTASFNMKASAKGFRIISTTLYKDPILAIVRELTCNSWDAHIANGNTNTPIEVHLPNNIEPWFAVKDFGVGMSDEEIFGVYTTVFDSTKDDSNDAIGAMGLGSKTPFSYNNGQSFIVTSIKDGMKAVYSAYLDNGEPAITCMVEPHPTDEAAGVEVKVPVNKEDFGRFIDAGKKVVPHFQNPSVNSNHDYGIEFEHNDLYYTKSGVYSTTVYAVMGNVVYPIDSQFIDYQTVRGYFKKRNLYIHFGIGDLDVAASREELHYDDRTIENIQTAVKNCTDGILNDAQAWLNEQDFENIRDAYLEAPEKYGDDICKDLLYKGQRFGDWVMQNQAPIPLTNRITAYLPAYNMSGCTRTTRLSQVAEVIPVSVNYRHNPLTIITNDMKIGGISVIKNYVKENRGKVFIYNEDDPSTTGVELLTDRMFPHEVLRLKTSDLKEDYANPKKARKKSARSGAPTIKAYQFVDGRVSEVELSKEDVKTKSYHFVSVFRNDIEKRVMSEISLCTLQNCHDIIKDIMRIKNIEKMYILRRDLVKLALKNKNAKHLLDEKITKKQYKETYLSEWSIIEKNADKWKSNIKNIWLNKAFARYFRVNVCETRLTNAHSIIKSLQPELASVADDYTREVSKRLVDIQQNEKYQLGLHFIDKYTDHKKTKSLLEKLYGKTTKRK